MRRQAVAAVALVVLTAALMWQAYVLYNARAANETIDGLLAGQDLKVADDAPTEVWLARGYFLMQRDLVDEASEVFYRLEQRGDTRFRGQLLYNLGNARLKSAIDLIQQKDFDRATSLVQLAKDLYREALNLEPRLWDAKYNLDVAQRIVRDLPQVSRGGDEDEEVSKKLWTQIPGFPSGLP